MPGQWYSLKRSSARGLDPDLVTTHHREVVARQHGDVFGALAQRRDEQHAIAYQAIVEIVPKGAARRERGEILVRGGDDRDVDRDRGAPADAAELLAFDRAQDLRLMIAAHRRHLVEEHGATVRTLQRAALVDGAGKGAARRAEELALEVILGNRGAVEYFVRSVGARRRAPQHLGSDLLADARLALDEHGAESGARDRRELRAEPRHGRRHAEQLRCGRRGRGHAAAADREWQRAARVRARRSACVRR